MLSCVTAVISTSAFAEGKNQDQSRDQVFTLSQALEAALNNNPSLQASRLQIDEGQAHLQQAGLWPNPEADFGWKFDNTFNNEGEQTIEAAISQPIALSGRIGASKRVAQTQLKLTTLQAETLTRQIISDVRKTFTTILAIDLQLELEHQIVDLNKELLELTSAGLKNGQISEVDVNAVQIEWQRALQRVRVLEAERHGQLIFLNRLTGFPVEQHSVLSGELDFVPSNKFDSEQTQQRILNRPDYRAAEQEFELAKNEFQLVRAERYEDVHVGLSFEQDDSIIDEGSPPATDRFLGVFLSVPLPLFDRRQGDIKGAKLRELRMDIMRDVVRSEIDQEVVTSEKSVEILEDLIKSYQPDLLKRAENNLTLVEAGYREGKTGMIEVIQSRQQFAELKSSYIEALRDYHLAIIDLETALGIYPDNIRVDINEEGKSHE